VFIRRAFVAGFKLQPRRLRIVYPPTAKTSVTSRNVEGSGSDVVSPVCSLLKFASYTSNVCEPGVPDPSQKNWTLKPLTVSLKTMPYPDSGHVGLDAGAAQTSYKGSSPGPAGMICWDHCVSKLPGVEI